MQHTLKHARLAGLAVTVGAVTKDFVAEGLKQGQSQAHLERIAKTVGLNKRQVAGPGVTTVDLCEDAARRLLAAMALSPESIDAVIFVTQTPDHLQPNNASLLHGRLGLKKTTAAFDLSLGCSGWVYGLHQAVLCATFAERILLCAGDTLTSLIHPDDHAIYPLFGDAGSVAIIERTPEVVPWHFVLGADGSKAKVIQVPAGGARQPSTGTPFKLLEDEDGNRRREDQLAIDGAEVFSFSLREVPPAVQQVMQMADWSVAEVEALILHQANEFLVTNLARKCGFPLEKVPAGLAGKYGNQSSASLPATLLEAYAAPLRTRKMKIVGCGFGVGLSWGAFATELGPCVTLPIMPLKS